MTSPKMHTAAPRLPSGNGSSFIRHLATADAWQSSFHSPRSLAVWRISQRFGLGIELARVVAELAEIGGDA